MTGWIPFEEGEYLVERSALWSPDHCAVVLEEAVLRVYADRRGQHHMEGRGRVRNALLVELLDDHDRVHLALDLGPGFQYILWDPLFKGGKVFAPDVRSILRFSPREPWEPIARKRYDTLWSRFTFLGS